MIHRAEHKDNFTTIANATIRDTMLSDSAKVLLFFMLSCSDEWNFSVTGLASALGWSKRKVMRLIPELKKAGYLIQKLQSDSLGRFIPSAWEVFEVSTAIHEARISVEPKYTKTATRLNRNADEPQRGKSVSIRNNNSKEITNIKKEQCIKESAIGIFQNVRLTNSEQEELINRYGTEEVGIYIDRLSTYMNENPEKHYKNHKATIEKWIIQDKERKAI